ncbi:MAG: methyltransferase [Oscillospiraceae bacterium]|nr:methyltransferase [Oscillospiraceae bacterium]
MNRIPYSEDEMKVIGSHPVATQGRMPVPPRYNTPVTCRENVRLAWKREGTLWIPQSSDFATMGPRVIIDNVARAFCFDCGPQLTDEEKGGKDMFGIEWVYVPVVGGSMVKPGAPTLEDANDWPEVIKFPDVSKFAWDECGKVNARLNETTRSFSVTILNGLYERLISFMDFEGAAMALIDEDQQDAVHSLFDRLADMYIEIMGHFIEQFPNLDGLVFHDDWGSQRAPFFSLDTCMEMIVPYLKKVADFCHSKGLWFQHHCCGKNEMLVPAMIEAGVDMWAPQRMNDVDMLRDKYGDKLMFAVYGPELPRDSSPEEIDAAAKALVEKYAPGFDEKPIFISNMFPVPGFSEAVYKYGRKALCG